MDTAAKQTAGEGQRKQLAAILTMVASAILVAAFFLPYASATGDFRMGLDSSPADIFYEPLEMTNADVADLSLFEYVRIYSAAGDLGYAETFAAVYVPLTAAAVILPAAALLFSLLKKPVPVAVFSVLTIGLTSVLNWDFEDRGVIPSTMYDWGIARWVYLGAAVAGIALAVWQIVLRRKAKQG